jgi:DDE superfamily endonuclease
LADVPPTTQIEIWFQDEMRIGQKNGCVRQWALRGTRPRQPADQRYESTYVFGAVCPARDTGAALVLPYANTKAMQLHVDDISRHVAPGAVAVVVMDNAGWHRTGKLVWPKNVRPLFIPPGCPELNAAENIWQYLRQTYLSNRVFATYADIVDAACSAWNKQKAETGRITSIATRTWTAIGQ